MKQNKFLLSFLSYTLGYYALLCFPALADQCSYISKKQAIKAISRLELNQTIYSLCEPCGDKEPQPMKIETLATETVDYEDFWQIKVNNGGIDLAYVFVDSGVDNYFVNLAATSNCPATKVSPVLSPQQLNNSEN